MNSTMTMHQRPYPAPRAQRGMALIISLLFLLVLTMLGMTSMQTTTMQERMAGNVRDRNVALQAAEAALRTAEEELGDAVLPPVAADQDYYYDPFAAADPPWWQTFDWDDDNNVGLVAVDGTYDEARYVVEDIEAFQSSSVSVTGEAVPEVFMYRITVRGTGLSPTAEVFLQSTYKYGEQ